MCQIYKECLEEWAVLHVKRSRAGLDGSVEEIR